VELRKSFKLERRKTNFGCVKKEHPPQGTRGVAGEGALKIAYYRRRREGGRGFDKGERKKSYPVRREKNEKEKVSTSIPGSMTKELLKNRTKGGNLGPEGDDSEGGRLIWGIERGKKKGLCSLQMQTEINASQRRRRGGV